MINFDEVENKILKVTDKNQLKKIREVVNYSMTIAKAECPNKIEEVTIASYLHNVLKNTNLNIDFATKFLLSFPNLDHQKILHAIKYHKEERITKDPMIGSVWDGYLLAQENNEINIMSTAKGIEILLSNQTY